MVGVANEPIMLSVVMPNVVAPSEAKFLTKFTDTFCKVGSLFQLTEGIGVQLWKLPAYGKQVHLLEDNYIELDLENNLIIEEKNYYFW